MSQKRIKLFQYLKSCVTRNLFVFLQEIHLSTNDEKKWENEFNRKLFFSQRKTNYGTGKLGKINKKRTLDGFTY